VYASRISSVSLRTVSVLQPDEVNTCALLRAPPPTVTMPSEPKTSPRMSEKFASAKARAPLSKLITTTAVSSRPASLKSGATSASAVA
jgi:hypothetical protein